jgi:GR25 family glycosyltransferase involved in LPS biosynthesis
MNFNDIPKFVINLERRKDRLGKISNEMKYMNWDFEVFKAIDENSFKGCSLSHSEIISIAKERNYPNVMVIEDDCTFMPYSRNLINNLNEHCRDLDFYILNMSPSFDRPVKKSSKYDLLLDLYDLPPLEPHHRGIYATNCIIYNEKSYDLVLEILQSHNLNFLAIDDFIYNTIFLNYQCYAPILPLAPQTLDWSDVSHGDYSNFYRQTYQWNLNTPFKIPNEFLDYDKNQVIKKMNIHKNFYYEN